MRRMITVGILATSLVTSAPARAQVAPQPVPSPAGPATQDSAGAQESGGFRRFVVDVGSDYKHFISWDTAKWIGLGAGAALAIHPADDELREKTQDDSATLLSESAGATYGNLSLQLPLAFGWWIAGHAAGSSRGAAAGRDMVRAQISAVSWTYVGKFIVNRERPNGDPRSFPSGHASAAFATAMVLQQHYGWKLGVPFFAVATYTAASRIVDNKHWASDVMFGAFLGMAGGRTVTRHVRGLKLAFAPMAAPGGGGLRVTVEELR
jgi:membrane-associated phospholipid phosphatase